MTPHAFAVMSLGASVETVAVVLKEPQHLSLRTLTLAPPSAEDVVVDIKWTGISSGTERLLWSGRMPPFPGLGYPLVPGYESVGEVVEAGSAANSRPGEMVFVPGAQCYQEAHGLFGGAASRLVTPAERTLAIDPKLKESGVLLALAATALHAVAGRGAEGFLPQLIVGHGVLGRLLARLTLAMGGAPPTVWETEPQRFAGARGYAVCQPEEDTRRDYRAIYDVSGDAGLIDRLIRHLAPGSEIVLAGFYEARPSFAFPPAFMKEARFRIAAEWQPEDLAKARTMIEDGSLAVDGLVTDRAPYSKAPEAYRKAFTDAACLKMLLDWSGSS